MSKDLKLMAFTPRVKRVIDDVLTKGGLRVYEQAHRVGRSSLDARGGGSAPAGYQGAFRILAQKNSASTYVIQVVDYQTYDSLNGTSRFMPCQVNGQRYYLQAWKSNPLSWSTAYVWLRYSAETQRVNIFVGDKGDIHDTDEYAFYLLGYVVFDYGQIKHISQQHLTGTAIFWHSVTCDLT